MQSPRQSLSCPGSAGRLRGLVHPRLLEPPRTPTTLAPVSPSMHTHPLEPARTPTTTSSPSRYGHSPYVGGAVGLSPATTEPASLLLQRRQESAHRRGVGPGVPTSWPRANTAPTAESLSSWRELGSGRLARSASTSGASPVQVHPRDQLKRYESDPAILKQTTITPRKSRRQLFPPSPAQSSAVLTRGGAAAADAALSEENDNLKAEIARLQRQLMRCNQRCEDLQSQVIGLSCDVDRLRTRVGDADLAKAIAVAERDSIKLAAALKSLVSPQHLEPSAVKALGQVSHHKDFEERVETALINALAMAERGLLASTFAVQALKCSPTGLG